MASAGRATKTITKVTKVKKKKRLTVPYVHCHLTWDGASELDVIWGQPTFIPLQDVLAMETLGPIVDKLHHESPDHFWVARFDAGHASNPFPIHQDTRSLLGMAIDDAANDALLEDIQDIYTPQSVYENQPTSAFHLVGSVIIHNEM